MLPRAAAQLVNRLLLARLHPSDPGLPSHRTSHSPTPVRFPSTPLPTYPPCSRSQSLGELYNEVGNAVLDSTDEVPSMFRERQLRRTRHQQQQQQQPRAKGGAGAAAAAAAAAGVVGRRARGVGGRAVRDVAMPGVCACFF